MDSINVLGTSQDSLELYRLLNENHEVIVQSDMFYVKNGYLFEVTGILLIAVMAIFTFYEVCTRKKEMAIRNIMGGDVKKSIAVCIVTDAMVGYVSFGGIRTMVFSVYSGGYCIGKGLLFLTIAIMVDSVMYTYWLFFDYKFTLGAGTNDKLVLIISNAVKFIVTILIIVVLGTGYDYLNNSIREYRKNKNLVEVLDEYAFCRVWDTLSSSVSDDIYAERYESMEVYGYKLYKEYFDEYSPIYLSSFGTNEYDVAFANCFADVLLYDFPEIQNHDEDIVIVYPEKYSDILDDIKMEIDSSLAYIIEDYNNNYSIGYESYAGRRVLENEVRTMYQGDDGEVRTYPVILYINSKELSKKIIAEDYEALYHMSEEEAKEFMDEYEMSENGFEILYTDYVEYSGYKRGYMKKMINLMLPSMVIILIIQLMLIELASSISYRLKSKKVALQEIMGVSMFGRHRGQFIWLIIQQAAVILTMTVIILSRDDNKTILGYVVIGVVLMLFDCISNIKGIIKTEKKNNVKVLKGGAL